MDINICYLYPALLNLYSDKGNADILRHRMSQRGINVNVYTYSPGDAFDSEMYDIILLGGGQDFETDIAFADMKAYLSDKLAKYIEGDGVFLAVCGDMLGKTFVLNGKKCEGLGILPISAHTDTRHTGNIAVTMEGVTSPAFENHSLKTDIGTLQPLGAVVKGFGNDGKCEGAVYKNTFFTHLHGPILSKNPELADKLISLALQKKYGVASLTPLDDEYETSARRAVLKKMELV